jgi:hypothetical protein
MEQLVNVNATQRSQLEVSYKIFEFSTIHYHIQLNSTTGCGAKEWNSNNCACECPTLMPTGGCGKKEWLDDKCKCECPASKTCTSPQVLDKDECECKCPANKMAEKENCKSPKQ